MNDSISYFYHRDDDYNVTIAYKRVGNWSKVIYGAAFCHSNDRFNKALGRKIAHGRMDSNNYSFECGSKGGRFGIHETILNKLSDGYEHSPRQFFAQTTGGDNE